jgi:predicted outer membrane repeat protein
MVIHTRLPGLLLCSCLFLLITSPAFSQELTPDYCYANSVLPSVYQAWQETPSWAALAAGPAYATGNVFLEILQGEYSGGLSPYNPPVVSAELGGVNFAVKNFAGLPDRWLFPRVYNETAQNLAHVAQYTPGEGPLFNGGSRTIQFGGLAEDCAMIRVFNVSLEDGRVYHFTLGSTHPDQDVRMALLRESNLPDGWAVRGDAYFERQAEALGSETAQEFIPTETGSYALVVFMNDLTVAGGSYTVGYQEYVVPELPDLRVVAAEPIAPTEGIAEPLEFTVRNTGGSPAASCLAALYIDGGLEYDDLPVPALDPGASAVVTCTVPGLPAGTHDLQIVVDHGETVQEGNETNNDLAYSIQVASAPLPDLFVDQVSPYIVIPNQPAELHIEVANGGPLAAPASSTYVDVDSGDHTWVIPTPAIPALGHVTVSQLLPGLAEGDHDLLIRVDDGNQIPEISEFNNEDVRPLLAEGPNLVVAEITPQEIIGNMVPEFEIRVTNLGSGEAAGGFLRVRLDGQVQCDLVPYPAIAPYGSAMVTCQAGGVLSPGSHSVEACADVTQSQPESDETDNCLTVNVQAIPSSVLVLPDGTGDYPTIQEGIDAVIDGGEVILAPGVYSGPGNRDITYGGKSLSVVTAFDGRAIIDCQGSIDEPHRGFIFNSGETNDARLVRVDIINGWVDTGAGGGILCSSSGPSIEDVLIRDCHADEGGAMAFVGTYGMDLRVVVEGCTIVSNYANLGGALWLGGNAGVMMDNTLIAQNSSYGGAVGVANSSDPTLELSCCDLWGNSGGDYTTAASGQLGIRNNISQNPLFCDVGAEDFQVASNSPCSAGVNDDCGRIGALGVGCGALGGTVRHVQADGGGQYLTIQHALNNCEDGDIVELADGTYTGTGNYDITTLGKAVVVRSASGNPVACRIDGQDIHRLFVFDDGEGPATVIQNLGILNGAAPTGAGILCNGSSPTFEGLRIWDCDATDDGGAIHCEAYASPVISQCTFENNTAADDGGALYAYNWSSPTVTGCVFAGNLAGDRGGGALFVVNSFPEVSLCTFVGNEAVNGGGVTFVYAYGPVTSCVFADNTGTYGGAAQCYGNAQVDFINCTMYGNWSSNGAQVYLRNNSSPDFDSCILAFGYLGASMARYADDCNPTLVCTDIWYNEFGDYPDFIADQLNVNGNFGADPLFCNAGIGNLYLRGDSPCAMVNNSECGQVGALPVGCTGSWLVRPDGSGDFATIQEAIDAAAPGETVVLADGVYTGAGNRELDLLGKDITLRSQSGDAAQCIIDCQGSQTQPHWGIQIVSGEGQDTVLENITITGAYRTYGAGGRIDGSSPTLRGMVFRDNGGGDGGGLIVAGGNPVLENCVFENNSVSDAGGGLYLNTSFAQLIGCVFRGNSAFWGGGGLYNQNSGPNVLDCVFEDNYSDHWGGAVHNRYADSAPNFTRCLFIANSAPNGGALFNRDGTTPSFTGCTFVSNRSANGAVLNTRSSSVTNLVRGLLVFSPEGAAITWDGTGAVTSFCSNVYGNTGGDWTGPLAGQLAINDNFAANPVFCDRYGGDYQLSSVSPCQPANSPCGWLVGALDVGCVLSEVQEDQNGEIPANLVLHGAVPNPFNPMTTISFAVPRNEDVEVAIYGVDGRRVAVLLREMLAAGQHEVVWSGRDQGGRPAASGVYFVRIKAGPEVRTGKIMLAR